MKILVALAFVAILGSLISALLIMMRGSGSAAEDGGVRPKGNMAKALSFRVGFSIALFLCILLAWKLGWIAPTGIRAGT